MSNRSKIILRGVKVHGEEPLNSSSLNKINYSIPGFLQKGSSGREEIVSKALEEGRRKGRLQGYEIGKNEGYQKGFEEGHKRAYQELSSLLKLTKQMVQELEQEQRQIYSRVRPEIVTLCLKVCEKLLYQSLQENNVFQKLLENLLQQGEEQFKKYPIEIFVSEEDKKMLTERLESVHFDQSTLQQDPKLPRGHFRIETKAGLVHFDPKRLLTNLREQLLSLPAPSGTGHGQSTLS